MSCEGVFILAITSEPENTGLFSLLASCFFMSFSYLPCMVFGFSSCPGTLFLIVAVRFSQLLPEQIRLVFHHVWYIPAFYSLTVPCFHSLCSGRLTILAPRVMRSVCSNSCCNLSHFCKRLCSTHISSFTIPAISVSFPQCVLLGILTELVERIRLVCGRSSVWFVARVQSMTYTIDTCQFLARRSTVIGQGKHWLVSSVSG